MPRIPNQQSLAMADSRSVSLKRPLLRDHSDQDGGQYYNYNKCDYPSHLATGNNIDGTSNKITMMNYNPTYQSNTSDQQWAKRQRSGTKSREINTYFKQGRHLVKTVSDLPEFVPIESYRVASYQIAGEPHLCLPQLLQYLKQKFTLRRLVEEFEKSMINFTSATLKQVDGFIKACVLPDDAKSCPLIKRSDADKVCLSLFEQCYKGKTNDIVKLCSMRSDPRNTKNFIPISSGSNAITTGTLNSGNLNSGGKDFESILALAQAVSSTLMIRVYHRCFGKCVGIYYPSLLLNSKLSCIECIVCKIMFTPRRFIGHTHGSKERGLCHWGFNSYNWRYYIKLSSKQTMNNLGADELLVKFGTLQTAAHYIDNESVKNTDDDEDYEFDEPDSENSKINNSIDNNNKKTSAQMFWQSTNTTVNDLYQHNNLVERSKKPTTSTTTISTYPRATSSFYPSITHYDASTPYYFTQCEGTSSRSASYNTVNTETKREIYVCSNLTSYLRCRGLNQSYIDDIVENTLNIIRESKSIT